MKNLVYTLAILMFFTSVFGVIISDDLLKKILLLSTMQVSIIIFFVEIGYKIGNFFSPIFKSTVVQYVNPVTHVLMLTAIVVSFVTMSIAIAIIIRIKEQANSTSYSAISKILDSKSNEF